MLDETINKRINNAIKRYIPNESDAVKEQVHLLILDTYYNLRIEPELDDNGKPYSESRDLHFAISITLDDIDTPFILEDIRKEIK